MSRKELSYRPRSADLRDKALGMAVGGVVQRQTAAAASRAKLREPPASANGSSSSPVRQKGRLGGKLPLGKIAAVTTELELERGFLEHRDKGTVYLAESLSHGLGQCEFHRRRRARPGLGA